MMLMGVNYTDVSHEIYEEFLSNVSICRTLSISVPSANLLAVVPFKGWWKVIVLHQKGSGGRVGVVLGISLFFNGIT